MQSIIFLIALFFFSSGCQNKPTSKAPTLDTIIYNRPIKDTIRPYTDLVYGKTELLASAPGTKSVLFNSKGTRLYAMNLEGMSVFEFDQASRKILHEFRFSPNKGIGWDYAKEKAIPSFQEKPVEGCLSHDDKILWVSLHNAGGIVPIRVDSLDANEKIKSNVPSKEITIVSQGSDKQDSIYVPLILTGKTPKVIAKTADSKWLLVSNWHSNTVSVLSLDGNVYPYGKVTNTVPVSSIPRGIAVDNNTGLSYVAIMGGASISVLSNSVWMKESDIQVASNPRHIVLDPNGRLFVSFNSLGQVAAIDPSTGKTLFTAATHSQPRTIALSHDGKFLFVTCYSGDMMDVFKITDAGFKKISSLPCKGHPVGVDIFEDNDKLEAWVCSYSTGSISIFSFWKK